MFLLKKISMSDMFTNINFPDDLRYYLLTFFNRFNKDDILTVKLLCDANKKPELYSEWLNSQYDTYFISGIYKDITYKFSIIVKKGETFHINYDILTQILQTGDHRHELLIRINELVINGFIWNDNGLLDLKIYDKHYTILVSSILKGNFMITKAGDTYMSKTWYVNYKLSDDINKPTSIFFNKKNMTNIVYYPNNLFKSKKYFQNGKIQHEIFFKEVENDRIIYHREDNGPTLIEYDINGNIIKKDYYDGEI